MNEHGTLKIKEWFFEKTHDQAKRYNLFIDFERNENGMKKIEDGCVTVSYFEKISESEKAICVRLYTGEVVGSGKGWKTWIPKSVIMN